MGGLSVRTKVFLLFAAAALLTVVPVLVLIRQAVAERVYASATQELESARGSTAVNWENSVSLLQEKARRIALEREVERLIREGEPGRLESALKRQIDEGQIAVAVDSAGRTLVGPVLDTSIVNTGRSAVFVPPQGTLPLRVAVRAVYMDTSTAPADTMSGAMAEDSVLIGMVGVAERLDTLLIAAVKSAAGGTDVALIAGDSVSVLASTLPDSLTAFLSGMSMRTVQAQGVRSSESGSLLYVAYRLNTTGRPAAIVLFRPVADELELVGGIDQSVIGIGVVALGLAVGLALVIARIVARPAQALAAAAADLARGNFGAPLPAASSDEIGQLTNAFRDMRSAIAEREGRLRSAQAELIHREKLAAMGRLVAQLSHEINNPIYNIQNCLEVLERRSDPRDPNREFLSLAQEELQRMAVLTRQMLDQSRPLADAAAPLDLNQLVQRVVALARPELDAHGIRASQNLRRGIPSVVAHPDALQQVLANLVANAIDAMPTGGELKVTTRADAEAVEVVVEDTGVGIAEEHLPHIFEAFYTTKPAVSGIGLGLFVSEGIIRGHRGRLFVESTVGKGSRFIVQLPRETLNASLATPDASETSEPAAV
ncbi:MAG: HAMP domain-containing histidine kinase [Gemmatimonadetes bacterium]|nr:HAMP domain-containing histidine kinase [Gemmatimonadota bacterium]